MANKKMTNLEIYAYADALMNAFQAEMTLPVKVNFYLQITKIGIECKHLLNI